MLPALPSADSADLTGMAAAPRVQVAFSVPQGEAAPFTHLLWTVRDSPLGRVLLVAGQLNDAKPASPSSYRTAKPLITALHWLDHDGEKAIEEQMDSQQHQHTFAHLQAEQQRWAKGRDTQAPQLEQADERLAPLGRQLFSTLAVEPGPLRLALRGTPFQLRVWKQLLEIPPGETRTYSQLARSLGLKPQSSRAVGTAVGANALAWLIPCHRVGRSDGGLGGYRWGLARKKALLAWEQQHKPQSGGLFG